MKILKSFDKLLKLSPFKFKGLLYLFLVLITTSLAYAQTAQGFGIKGGLNYNSNGDYFDAINDAYKNPSSKSGFHLGAFGKFGNDLYFRPELVYTSTKSDYDNDSFKMQKIDAPILVGLNVLGPLSVFGGPAFQYILDSEFSGISINDIEKDFTVGLNFGVGFNLNKFGIDLRYERGFNKNEARFINDNIIDAESRINTRPSQLILSLSLLL
ncbi:outer membrane beta-barrel protein [Tamlana sp. 2201CG12-4]|uniref:outer membrane beta-barrel protein n=1 Tax=Tamlana sp. 2201CG12-4 TaxID=3112582 RepID=UPI002DBD4043|nr:outer membrane beta-barrel protein [Tamlana sp. 2201CG12-4]MEC3908866.1 outer membrane beta-barrel protein [Tamlana sp. 2201CG12-4]